MKHFAPREFWQTYQRLPKSIQTLADKNFKLLKRDPTHPSLAFKRIGRLRSVRVGIHYRALAVEDGEDLVWFWIGPHAEYDRILHG
jgi:hypothetical protein